MRPFSPCMEGLALPRHPFDPDGPAISADVPVMQSRTNKDEATLFVRGDPRFRRLHRGRSAAAGQGCRGRHGRLSHSCASRPLSGLLTDSSRLPSPDGDHDVGQLRAPFAERKADQKAAASAFHVHVDLGDAGERAGNSNARTRWRFPLVFDANVEGGAELRGAEAKSAANARQRHGAGVAAGVRPQWRLPTPAGCRTGPPMTARRVRGDDFDLEPQVDSDPVVRCSGGDGRP